MRANGRVKKMKMPRGWSMCNRSNALIDPAVAPIFSFKVPLSDRFPMTPDRKFTPSIFLAEQVAQGRAVRMVVDLTYTDKYYDGATEFVPKGVEYVKIREKGHSAVPKRRNIERFKLAVMGLWARRPGATVAVHCTHGFNRSGFFIVCLLIECLSFSLPAALASFAKASPPGIWDRDYVLALHEHYKCPPPDPSSLPDPPPWRRKLPTPAEPPALAAATQVGAAVAKVQAAMWTGGGTGGETGSGTGGGTGEAGLGRRSTGAALGQEGEGRVQMEEAGGDGRRLPQE